MYGTRRAATNWQTHYTKVLVQNGFTTGLANNCTFYNPEKYIYCMVHGDDFVAVGEDEDVEWFKGQALGWFEMEVRGKLGDGEGDEKEMVILGRRMRWTIEGLELEADRAILKRLKEQFGFDDRTRAAASNGEKVRQAMEEQGELL